MNAASAAWPAFVVGFGVGAGLGLVLPMLRYWFAGQRRRARFDAEAVDTILLIGWHMSAGTWRRGDVSFKIARRISRHAGPASYIEGLMLLGRLAAGIVGSDDPVVWASLRERLEAALANPSSADE